MSVSKSIVGCVAGILAGRGALDVTAPVEQYVPEVAGSGYGGATVRDLLDMRTGVQFRETYDEPDAEVRVMERSMGWRPRLEGDPVGAYAYLASLGRAEPHGGTFTYRSADTDMLGWVCERAAGTRMADLVSTLLWQPMGAEARRRDHLRLRGHRHPRRRHLGGPARPRPVRPDAARRRKVDGREVVPAAWLEDAWNRPDDVRAAFAASDNEEVLPGGWYRNQFWFVPTTARRRRWSASASTVRWSTSTATTRLVGVKLSSWPTPQHTPSLVDTLRAFGAIGATLAAEGSAGPSPQAAPPGSPR